MVMVSEKTLLYTYTDHTQKLSAALTHIRFGGNILPYRLAPAGLAMHLFPYFTYLPMKSRSTLLAYYKVLNVDKKLKFHVTLNFK